MCHWGVAQASRMNLNARMSEAKYIKGKQSIKKATHMFSMNRQRIEGGREAEISIIEGLLNATLLCFAPSVEMFRERSGDFYQAQYSGSLRVLYLHTQKFEQEVADSMTLGENSASAGFSAFGLVQDIGVFLAEALLNLTPWKYYEDVNTNLNTQGYEYIVGLQKVRMNTLAQEVIEILQELLCVPTDPTELLLGIPAGARARAGAGSGGACSDHPLGLHLYIHVMEQMDTPLMALSAADRLASE